MGTVAGATGISVDTSGELRILELQGKYYVVGQDLLISVKTKKEAYEEMRKLKCLEY